MTPAPITTVPAITTSAHPNQLPPVVLDLGKTKKKLIRALKSGEGPLMDDVAEAVEAVRTNLGPDLDGKALIPVVIVYKRSAGRKRGFLPFAY